MAERPENDERAEELHIQRRGEGAPESLHIERRPETGMRGGLVMPAVRPARAEASELVAHGIAGGLLGGLAMLIVAMVVGGATGRGWGEFVRLVAGMFYGTGAMSGIAPLIVGTLTHLAASVAFGIVFALIVGRFDPSLFWWGLFYGVVVWAVAFFGLLPLLNPFMAAAIPPILYLLYHLVYGATLGSYLAGGST